MASVNVDGASVVADDQKATNKNLQTQHNGTVDT